MTLIEIINEVDVRVPNEYTLAQKIRWADLAQKKLYKLIGGKKTHTFLTVDDQELYTLPDNIKTENIVELWIASTTAATSNYQPYSYSSDRTVYGTSHVYYRSDYDGYNQIGIYPVPTTTGLKAKLIYVTKPAALTGENMQQIPDIDEDYHEMIILDCAMQVILSGDSPDIDLYNNYAMQYNALNGDMLLGRYDGEPQYPRTKDVMKKGRFHTYGQRNNIWMEYQGD